MQKKRDPFTDPNRGHGGGMQKQRVNPEDNEFVKQVMKKLDDLDAEDAQGEKADQESVSRIEELPQCGCF